MLSGDRKIVVLLEKSFFFFFPLSLEFWKMTTAPLDFMPEVIWKLFLKCFSNFLRLSRRCTMYILRKSVTFKLCILPFHLLWFFLILPPTVVKWILFWSCSPTTNSSWSFLLCIIFKGLFWYQLKEAVVQVEMPKLQSQNKSHSACKHVFLPLLLESLRDGWEGRLVKTFDAVHQWRKDTQAQDYLLLT